MDLRATPCRESNCYHGRRKGCRSHDVATTSQGDNNCKGRVALKGLTVTPVVYRTKRTQPWGLLKPSTTHNEYSTHPTTSSTTLHSLLLSQCHGIPPEAIFARIRAFSSMTAVKSPLSHPQNALRASGHRPSSLHPNSPRRRGPNEMALLRSDPKSE